MEQEHPRGQQAQARVPQGRPEGPREAPDDALPRRERGSAPQRVAAAAAAAPPHGVLQGLAPPERDRRGVVGDGVDVGGPGGGVVPAGGGGRDGARAAAVGAVVAPRVLLLLEGHHPRQGGVVVLVGPDVVVAGPARRGVAVAGGLRPVRRVAVVVVGWGFRHGLAGGGSLGEWRDPSPVLHTVPMM